MRRLMTVLVAAGLLSAASPLDAANREHEQILADIRMLQEQNQRLQLALTTLGDVLTRLTTTMDEQGNATRKGFADQKLLVDTMSGELRVLREKLDETNVRLTSLSQDVEDVRDAIPRGMPPPPSYIPGTEPDDAATAPPDGAPQAGAESPDAAADAPSLPTATGTTPRRLFDMAYADYTAGQWSLAVNGFETYLKTYPKSEFADDAQYYIGESYSGDSKFKEAVAAYERVIRDYPRSDILPEAWYKVGITYERLSQPDRAREAFDHAVKTFPETDAGRLAKQRLDGLNRQR